MVFIRIITCKFHNGNWWLYMTCYCPLKKWPLEGGTAQKLPKTEVRETKATVLYIERIPHGFYENEMEGFFKQFGTIKRLRIAGNKKTGKSKHFGFIEFESPEVANVVGILCITISCLSTYCKFSLFLLNMYIQDCGKV